MKFAGARNVVVTDMNPYRLELAAKLGATRTVNLKEENLKDVMKQIGMTEGFDVGLEMSGSQAALDDMQDWIFLISSHTILISRIIRKDLKQ